MTHSVLGLLLHNLMPENLPQGWVRTTLGELNTPSRVRVLPSDYPTLPYIGMEHIQAHTMKLVGPGDSKGLKGSLLKFEIGDVLYSRMRPYLNKVWVAEFDGLCSPEFLVFPRIEGVNSRLFANRLNSYDFVGFANSQVSGERPRVDFGNLSKFSYLLAPKQEQDRIAEKLERLLSRLEAGESAARRALERLNRYRAAVLHAAITGELTASWRDAQSNLETGRQLLTQHLQERQVRWREFEFERRHATKGKDGNDKTRKIYPHPLAPEATGLPHIPDTWVWASADQLTDATRPITYGIIKLGMQIDGGTPVLRSSNVRRLKLELDYVKRVAPQVADEYRRTYLQGREVLVTVRGTLGGVAVVPPTCSGFNISREVALLALLYPESSNLIAFFIASDLLQQWLNARAKGVAYTGINIETLRQLPIPIAPVEEQRQIVSEVARRLEEADKLEAVVEQQITRASAMRESIRQQAFTGQLVHQDSNDGNARTLLQDIKTDRAEQVAERKVNRPTSRRLDKHDRANMEQNPSLETLRAAWLSIDKELDAHRLFESAGFVPGQVLKFYELLRAAPEICEAFKNAPKTESPSTKRSRLERAEEESRPGRFRLVSIWLENFKNLKDYRIRFDSDFGVNVVLGWNGTGKSNLFEALVIIFRDLHYWKEKNKWPEEPMASYRLTYEIEGHLVEIIWDVGASKRPVVRMATLITTETKQGDFEVVKRENLALPKFIFGYYSGPTNRLAEHFAPMKRDHYDRLRGADVDDHETLAALLEQRRFFCAETHHAKYVLLAFSYKEDLKIRRFLEDRLRILGFESALFIIRRPRWARKGSSAENFWGATGIMLRVMEKLRDYAIAPMVVEQIVNDGYRTTKEDHFFFFLPDMKSLHAFADEYADARSFFLALESTDFSELIHDAKIQVRVKASGDSKIPITFRELSEGEQQLLMVLGLMRFTKSHQSLVLLDEPDTHLNPHWSVEYVKDLASLISDDENPSPEQQSSQMLMATHDPLVIASFFKEQVHLLKRDPESLHCYWNQASENPRGLGYTGILISDMFGFRSDLDEETLALLDRQVHLAQKPNPLSSTERSELGTLTKQIDSLGFKTVSSDPYYRAFIQALSRRQEVMVLMEKPVQTNEDRIRIRQAADDILAELIQKHELKP